MHRMQLHKKRLAMQRGLAVAMIRPFGKVLTTNKMIPTSSKGSLYEFFKLPYNPATPRRRKSALWDTVKRSLYFVQFLFKSIPVWIEIISRWLNPPPPKSITGWNALVTGGSNGIGRAVSLELAKFGCNVIIADLDMENGEKTVQEALKYRVKAAAYKVDVSDYEAVVNLGRKIERDFGHVDILVNNAGIIPYLVPDEYSSENIRRMMEVNVLSHFWTIKTFLPGMYQRRRGHIVGLSSRTAYIPTGYIRNYATTKYAVRGFMEDLHDEIYHAGMEEQVVTSTVFPVLINTRKESIDHFMTLPGYDQMTLPTPEEAGKSIVEGIRTNQRKLFVPNDLKTWQLALFDSATTTAVSHSIRKFCARNDVELDRSDEYGDICLAEITIMDKRALLFCLYISPDFTIKQKKFFLARNLFMYSTDDMPMVVTGNFNIDLSREENFHFVDFMRKYLRLELASDPTKATTLGGSCVDLTFIRNIRLDSKLYYSCFFYHRPILSALEC